MVIESNKTQNSLLRFHLILPFTAPQENVREITPVVFS